jgi:hypothetical protein
MVCWICKLFLSARVPPAGYFCVSDWFCCGRNEFEPERRMPSHGKRCSLLHAQMVLSLN